MAKKDKAENVETLHNGVRLTGDIVHGTDNRLTPGQQGQKARGELDENLNVIPKDEKVADEKGAVKAAETANDARDPKEKAADEKVAVLQETRAELANGPVKTDEKQYVGWISAEATAAATGQKVSLKWEQAQPTTEDGLFHSFLAHHPSAKRDTFKIDPENKIDPTLRTYLERTTPAPVAPVNTPATAAAAA